MSSEGIARKASKSIDFDKISGPRQRILSTVSDRGDSDWESLMRKFSEANKEKCKAVCVEMPCFERSTKKFPTGSQYEGTWDVLGMSGYGTYTFPHGVIYEGEFEDGIFHGTGELRYESGAIIRGKWKHGHIVEKTLVFADGLEYSETDWKYCRMPDRRFTVEYEEGMQPAGDSFMTADQPTREIPPGYYDTGDGLYDPKTKVVYKYDDLTAIVRSPSLHEQKWILSNCRTTPDLPLGPATYLYEEWQEPNLKLDKPPPPAAPTKSQGTHLFDEDVDNVTLDDFDEESWWHQRVSTFSSGLNWKNRRTLKFAEARSSNQTSHLSIHDTRPRHSAVAPAVSVSQHASE